MESVTTRGREIFRLKKINMQRITKMLSGAVLLTVPTIEFGGYFLLNIISGKEVEMGLTPFQEAMFRAGHAHAGVLVILALVTLVLSDHARISKWGLWFVRLGFPIAAILISGGFFAAATGPGLTEPNGLIWILYLGVLVLAVSLITLGVGLIRSK